MQASLHIHDLEIPVKIGVSDEERKKPQPIHFDIYIRFSKPPVGVKSDRLEDTVCYDELSQKLEKLTTSKEYHLIEYLAGEAFEQLKQTLPAFIYFKLGVKKVYPPLQQENKGVSYILEEGSLR